MKFVVLCIALFAVQAFAGQTQYFGEDLGQGEAPSQQLSPAQRLNSNAARAQFEALFAGPPQIDSFEGFAVGTDIRGSNLDFGVAGTASFTATGAAIVQDTIGSTNGRYPTTGSNFLQLNSGDNVEITFSNPNGVAAIGFNGIDIGDFAGTIEVECVNGVVTNYPLPVQTQNGGSVLFWGVTSDEIATNCKSIRFQTTGGGDVFAFDDFTVGDITELVDPPPTGCCTAEELNSGECADNTSCTPTPNGQTCTSSNDGGTKVQLTVPSP